MIFCMCGRFFGGWMDLASLPSPQEMAVCSIILYIYLDEAHYRDEVRCREDGEAVESVIAVRLSSEDLSRVRFAFSPCWRR